MKRISKIMLTSVMFFMSALSAGAGEDNKSHRPLDFPAPANTRCGLPMQGFKPKPWESPDQATRPPLSQLKPADPKTHEAPPPVREYNQDLTHPGMKDGLPVPVPNTFESLCMDRGFAVPAQDGSSVPGLKPKPWESRQAPDRHCPREIAALMERKRNATRPPQSQFTPGPRTHEAPPPVREYNQDLTHPGMKDGLPVPVPNTFESLCMDRGFAVPAQERPPLSQSRPTREFADEEDPVPVHFQSLFLNAQAMQNSWYPNKLAATGADGAPQNRLAARLLRWLRGA